MVEHILSLILVSIVIILLSIPEFWFIEDSRLLDKLKEIKWKDKIKIFKPKSEEQKEIDEQRKELDQLIKYRDYQRELSNINQERESVLKDIEGLDESNDEKLKRWKFEYMDVPEPKGVDPEPFMRQFMSGQSTKKAGEECNRAIPPHVKPYIHPSLTTHDNFSRQKNDDQQKALNILLEDMKHEKL